MFQLGDEVFWTSSSNGTTKAKRGTVEVIVKKGMVPTRALQLEANVFGGPRTHESYMVRVHDGKPGKGKLYWPRASLLQPVSGDSQFRTLKPKGRKVPVLKEPVPITIHTRCPGKWVMVDMETGESFGHDGKEFTRLGTKEAEEAAAVLKAAAARK